MSKRMIHQIDVVTAYGRWLTLIAIPVIALLVFPDDLQVRPVTLLIVVWCKAVVDAIPVVLLRVRLFPNFAALAFLILDSVFCLVLLALAGPGMFFYGLIPAIALSVRYEWVIGLIDVAVLVVGYLGIAVIRAGFRDVAQTLLAAFYQALALTIVSMFSGMLAENIKSEPPLNADEVEARQKELQRLRLAADRLRAVYEMAGTLSATLNQDTILEAVLEISSVGFAELDEHSVRFRDRPAGAVFLFSESGMYVAASRRIRYEERDSTLSGERGVLRRALSSGEPFVLGNLAEDPELRQFSAFRRCGSAICVPLRAGFEIYGAVLFASPRPGTFGEEHIELLNAVSNQAAIALVNAQLYQDLQEGKERIIKVVEEARTKLARDLHDGPTQSISAIAMRLNFVRLLLAREPQKVKNELFKLENLARRTTKEIRTMLFTLRPVVLETQGLKAAVEQLADRFRETDALPITLDIEELEGKLDVSVQAVAWFITQECLTNIKKHANAQNIEVKMYIRDDEFITEITDDGTGFDLETEIATYEQRGSFGLLNILERAELVNGRTTIKSAPEEGTQITLVVPLSREVI